MNIYGNQWCQASGWARRPIRGRGGARLLVKADSASSSSSRASAASDGPLRCLSKGIYGHFMWEIDEKSMKSQ